MLIQTTILYCDGKIRGEKCPARFLITNTLQPLIEGLDHGWKMVNPTKSSGSRAETFHYCPRCAPLHRKTGSR
jgi:hypothetical protein